MKNEAFGTPGFFFSAFKRFTEQFQLLNFSAGISSLVKLIQYYLFISNWGLINECLIYKSLQRIVLPQAFTMKPNSTWVFLCAWLFKEIVSFSPCGEISINTIGIYLDKRTGHFHHSTIKWNFPLKGGVFYTVFNFYFILPPPTACQLSRARFKWWAEFIQGDRIRAELHITFIFKFMFPWLSAVCNYSYMVKYCFFHIYLSWGLGVNAKEWSSLNNSFEKLLHVF